MDDLGTLLEPALWDMVETALQLKPVADDAPRIYKERDTEESLMQATADDLENAMEDRPCDYTRQADIYAGGIRPVRLDPEDELALEMLMDCEAQTRRLNNPFRPIQGCLPKPRHWGVAKVLNVGSVMLIPNEL